MVQGGKINNLTGLDVDNKDLKQRQHLSVADSFDKVD